MHLAIGVGVGGFQQQVLRLAAGGHFVHRHFASAVFVQRYGQLVGNDAVVHTGVLVYFVVSAAFAARFTIVGCEIELAVVRKAQVFFAHQGRYAHRQVGSTAAGHVVDLHIHRHGLGIDQSLLLSRRYAAFQHRQAELLHAELHGLIVTPGVATVESDLVNPQLGRGGNSKRVLCTQATGCSGAPGDGLGVLLATAHVGDAQRVGA